MNSGKKSLVSEHPDNGQHQLPEAATDLIYTSEQLQDEGYLNREFPGAVALDNSTKFEVWTVPQGSRLTIEQIKAAMIKDGLTPASPQHGPAFVPEQVPGSIVWIPQRSKSADADGRHQVAYLDHYGQDCEFYLYRELPGSQWYAGDQFLGVRAAKSA